MIYYVAHPVSGDVKQNLINVKLWIRWLIDTYPEHAFIAPWITYVEVLDDSNPVHRARGMRDDLLVIPRCDGIVLVGGLLSSGMAHELDAARMAGKHVLDLLHLGTLPPLFTSSAT